MKRLILFGLCMIILLATSAEAATLNTTNIVYYSFDQTNVTGATAIDISTINPQYNGTAVNAVYGQVGILNDSMRCDGTDDHLDFGMASPPSTTAYTYNFWVNLQADENGDRLLNSNGGGGWFDVEIDTSKWKCSHFDVAWKEATATTSVNVGNRMMITCRKNATHIAIYINGTKEASAVAGGAGGQSLNTRMCETSVGANDLDSYIDEVGIWNRSLNNSEITALYNGHSALNFINGGVPAPPFNDSLNITAWNPANLVQYNSNPVNTFNVTVDSQGSFNCSLYVNNTVNQTILDPAGGKNRILNFSVNFTASSTYTWYFNCTNGARNETTAARTLYFDDNAPVITAITVPNNMVFFRDNLTGQWNFTDNFWLHAYNITIDGTQIYYQNELNVTSYLYNLTYNTSSLTPGNHTLGVRLSDGHTAQVLGGDYQIEDGLFNQYLKYTFWDSGSVEIRGLPDSIFDEFTTERQTDRYTFTYEPSSIQDNYTFEVKSEERISIASKPGSKISKWLIMGDHWLDFHLPTEPNAKVSITRIDDYNVRVTITGLDHPAIQMYSSIGDLNIVEVNYTFGVANATLTYSTIVNELETQTVSLRFNTTSPLINGTNATFFYNGTQYSLTKTINADNHFYTTSFLTPQINPASANVTLLWYYNISSVNGTESGNLTRTQTVVQIGIDNCSTYTTRAYNISLFNETDDSNVTGTIDGYFQIWVSSISQYRAFNISWHGNNTYGLCINDPNATYTASAQLEYGAPGFSDKTYYWTNTTLDNTTDQLNLYLTDDTTQVTFYVTDENDDDVVGAYIHVATYDLGTNSYQTTEILQTGSDGEAFGQIVLNTVWYKFFIYYQGTLYLETIHTRVTTTTKTFRINLGSDFFPNYNTFKGTSCRVTFNNATNNFNFIFSDSTGGVSRACLTVINRTINSDTTIVNSCLNTASGNILGSIGANPYNNTFIGKGTLYIGSEQYTCGIYTHALEQRFRTFGDHGLFLTFLVVLTLAAIGIASPVIAITLTLLGAVLMVIFGLWFLKWSVLVTVIILGGIALFKLSRNR